MGFAGGDAPAGMRMGRPDGAGRTDGGGEDSVRGGRRARRRPDARGVEAAERAPRDEKRRAEDVTGR